MKKLFVFIFFAALPTISTVNAQPSAEPSGIYQNLTLGVDAKQGVLTGYYKEVYEPPNLPHLECSFFIYGKKNGTYYTLEAGTPDDKKNKMIAGQLSFYSQDASKPSVLMKLEESPSRDCRALKPTLAKDQGVYFDLQKLGSWSEVRMVAHSKAPYYQSPELSAPTRDSAKRGTILTVVGRQSGWVQVQADQKPKGWIREEDLFPMDSRAIPENPKPFAAAKPSPAAKPVLTPAAPEPKAVAVPDTQDALIDRLLTINAQSFDMAMQVVKNPEKRKSLASQRSEKEKELNNIVSRLNVVAPLSYSETSKDIIEAFLDLQYVRQESPVVSLRLNKVIQNFGK